MRVGVGEIAGTELALVSPEDAEFGSSLDMSVTTHATRSDRSELVDRALSANGDVFQDDPDRVSGCSIMSFVKETFRSFATAVGIFIAFLIVGHSWETLIILSFCLRCFIASRVT